MIDRQHSHHFTKRVGLDPYASIILPPFIAVPLSSQESERLCIYVLRESTLHFYNFSIGFWSFSDSVVFCCFSFYFHGVVTHKTIPFKLQS